MFSRRTSLSLLLSLSSLSLLGGAACDVPPGTDDDGDLETRQQHANLSGEIPVLDIRLDAPNTIATLDDHNVRPKVSGDVFIYQQHGTPRIIDGQLHLAAIRNTPSTNRRIEIKLRGASSSQVPKKSYSLDFTSPIGFLGMPEETEWVLHASYFDPSFLRNVLAYWQMARFKQGWAPRTEFVEVFINGDYRGLYVAIEKIKHGVNRVNQPLNDKAFIIKRDAEGSFVSAIDGAPWDYQSPNKMTSAQKSFAQSELRRIEGYFKPGLATYNPSGYQDVLSERSIVYFMIMQELSFNVDGYRKSLHLTRDNATGRGLVGPIWDFDLAFGNFETRPSYDLCGKDGWRITTDGAFTSWLPAEQVWQTAKFRRAFHDRYWWLRSDASLSRGAIDTFLDQTSSRISAARMRDEMKWHTLARPHVWSCAPDGGTYAEEIARLKKWARERIEWIDARLLEPSFLTP